MDIKNFFLKILNGSKGINIPEAVTESFNKQFNNPLNVEWIKADGFFEAVFYENEHEHIARFSPEGKRISMKINLPLDIVPEVIKKTAEKHGELMNAIAIHLENEIKYELIIRDKKLIRYFLLLNSNGEVIEKEKL